MTKPDFDNLEILNIIQQAKNGDTKSVEKLIKYIQKYVFAFFLHLVSPRETVADLTQEVLVKTAKNLNKLKDNRSFKKWLNQIIINTYYDYIKTNKKNNIDYNFQKFYDMKDKTSSEPAEQYSFSETEEFVIAAILKLPKFLRLTIVLREFDGMSYKDIAKITHAGIGTVKSRISRARFRLQQELKNFI